MSNERVTVLKENLLTKNEALEKIASFENCKEVLVRGKVDIQFSPSLEDSYVLSCGEEEYVLDSFVFTKLCRLVGVPSTYVKKIPPELLFPHLKYWFDSGEMEAKGFVRDDGNSLVGLTKGDGYYYPVSRILEQVDKVTTDYLIEGLDGFSWRNSSFGVVLPEFEFAVEGKELSEGDWIYGGLKFKNSLLSEFPLRLSAFLLTLACLNGMVSVDEIYKFNRKHGFEGQDSWVISGVQQAISALSAEVKKVQQLTSVPITSDAIPHYVYYAFDQLGIAQRSREAVLSKIIERNPRNLYELMNAVTETAHTIENRYEVYALQTLGGYVASHISSCSTCKRPF